MERIEDNTCMQVYTMCEYVCFRVLSNVEKVNLVITSVCPVICCSKTKKECTKEMNAIREFAIVSCGHHLVQFIWLTKKATIVKTFRFRTSEADGCHTLARKNYCRG